VPDPVVKVPSSQRMPDENSFNYAAFDAGAKLLASSPGMKSAQAILSSDNDRYMMSPCDSRQWFVVQLSEVPALCFPRL
jgi:hypothetical protein